jgi:cephalosporin hydroxylase
MRLVLDTDRELITLEGEKEEQFSLYSNQAFELLSKIWLKLNWNQRHTYTFTWLGRPIIQLPEDVIRYQEAIFALKPDVIIETGIAHGGSLTFSASLCKLMGKGRVIGVDIDIRPHNFQALQEHDLFPFMTLIQGSSTDPEIIQKVKSLIKPHETVLVLLDSNHKKSHVLTELEAYAPLVTSGSFVIVADGMIEELHDVPRGKADWKKNNPKIAAQEFILSHPEFELKELSWIFNENALQKNITHWPGAWLRRK